MLREIPTAAVVIPVVVACAPFAQAATQPLSQEQLVFVGETCTRVLGLKEAEAYFDSCRQTLSASLETKQDQALAWAYQACRQQALAPKSAALSTCTFDRQQSAPAAAAEPLRVSYSANRTKVAKSFYAMAPSQRFNRERDACAQLGLEPHGSFFAQCVDRFQEAYLIDPN